MYKRTIWLDDVEGVQEGTDMSASNFNNIEAGVMEANALAALNASYRRYGAEVAKNNEVIAIIKDVAAGDVIDDVVIPANATRNNINYSVATELVSVKDGTAGDFIIISKQANGFQFKNNGTGSCRVRFLICGGML